MTPTEIGWIVGPMNEIRGAIDDLGKAVIMATRQLEGINDSLRCIREEIAEANKQVRELKY